MSSAVVAVIHLGRPQARGEVRRVRSWSDVIRAAGASPVSLPLLPLRPVPADLATGALSVVSGRRAPETLAWSPRRLRHALHDVGATHAIALTTRAFVPSGVDDLRGVVLDFVDRLSVSYRDRSRIVASPLRRASFRSLGRLHGRVEQRIQRPQLTAAAGWEDARQLDATWVPVTVEPVDPSRSAEAPVDLLFTGNLSYPPNVDAVHLLVEVVDHMARTGPVPTVVLAGATPAPAVRALAQRRGWQVVADFADPAPLYAAARVAIAPLRYTAGIQIKVLDAATFGVPVVATPEALAGFDPDLPALSAHGAAGLAAHVRELLADPSRQVALGAELRDHVLAKYAPGRFGEWLRRALALG
jgi:glycosyltransferase involved in cell wall biosynthesis